MNIETLLLLGVVYAIGFYITAFVVSMWDASLGIKFDFDEWYPCIVWPLFILILIVIGLVAGLSMLYKSASSRMGSRFPATVRSVQAVSLVFRPTKLGEIIGKRIFRDRV